jgi:hypothetical protein
MANQSDPDDYTCGRQHGVDHCVIYLEGLVDEYVADVGSDNYDVKVQVAKEILAKMEKEFPPVDFDLSN